ncbi:MAG: hypothetical protein JO125_03445 [Chloroflexi bacterium]|nr:hypothetical protein [Ktedonobacteraceae bacterium]MBV9706445.1 hypothetical protein [Chloroflexota bacterium]
MQKNFYSKRMMLAMFLMLLSALAACSPNGSSDAASVGNSNNATATSVAPIQTGGQTCPVAVSLTTYWNPIIPIQANVNNVEKVTCAHLKNDASLQALVTVRAEGPGAILDLYIYDNITSPSPKQLFKLLDLYKGDARISAYNTLLTGEVDQNSSINKNTTASQMDLFREFAWSERVGTLIPVSFPGIFPDLTRYQAEADQQQVDQGQQSWKLHADMSAARLAATLLHWSLHAPTTIVSGGGPHDSKAEVIVKSTSPSGGSIKVSLSRLENNTNNGIWSATAVTSDGIGLTSPPGRDYLSSPITITGNGNAPIGKIGSIVVLNHLYMDIGHADAVGTSNNGNTTFAAKVSFDSSFKSGYQEGLVVLYSYSNADGSIIGAVVEKELLS